MQVIFHELADDEYWDQIEYYRKIDLKLSEKFESAVGVVVDGISNTPYLCHNRGDGIYSARVRGFPFSVFYKINEKYIFVVSVCHERRDPKIWKIRK